MDYASFASMISPNHNTKACTPHSLWMSSIKNLRERDKLEGIFSLSRKSILQSFITDIVRSSLKPNVGKTYEIEPGHLLPFESTSDLDFVCERAGKLVLDALEHEVGDFCVTCFTKSPHESKAMWDLYCPSGHGVCLLTDDMLLRNAIVSSTRINQCIGHNISEIAMGSVEYLDKLSDSQLSRLVVCNEKTIEYRFPYLLDIVFEKSVGYRHEEEYRLAAKPLESQRRGGYSLPLNWNDFVIDLRVHPRAPGWFYDLVCSDLKRASIEKSASRSSIDASMPDEVPDLVFSETSARLKARSRR